MRGWAWMNGASIWACRWRYTRKASLAQQPLTLTTSKGTFQRRYSSVDLMRIPCPCNGLVPACMAALAKTERNFFLVSGL
ncbi:hypothetical protein PAXRUDRAFT_792290 [Paxillus rubicundulus Ve08.2h10]|uniref:Uncharacterized protein n=1 Tax=Paxillus rubicundulus Ve08.2h10 TaxID=930991 RepID=A0A0D0DZK5_9AGAM|nr:hypothetical protein PAXRUDRAFT_792290 [Paxillus rubicundulus Ve08.2h10]